jgi:acyl-CoA synthetase (AMP-forming)/AMP-acid ligase II
MDNFWELEKHGDAPALIDDTGDSCTYAELAQAADRLVAGLGTGKKLVFLLGDNSPGSCIGYLACLRSGHVPLLLNPATDAPLLDDLVRVYRPDFFWKEGVVPGGCNEAGFGLHPGPGGGGMLHAELALLLTTSGSTGSQKLVRLSLRNLAANAASIVEYLELGPDERPITVLPMNYTYGLSIINSHLAAGARILLTNEAVVRKEFWNFFRDGQATSLAGVPYTYDIYRRLGLQKMDLPSLRTMTQAGGKLPADRVEEFAGWAASRGIRFFVMYGQTEATARMSYLPPERVLEKCASVGIAIPGGRFSILDTADNEITVPGVDGELVYHGENVSLGYAETRADLAKGDENGGMLKTGDIARYDDESYVYITGRLKRFIKLTGNRIGLDEVEQLLKKGGVEAVCGGRDNLLCVAVHAEADKTLAETLLADSMKIHHTMMKVLVVDGIPRNDSGKVRYQALFEEHL